jgi:hypothetical protein
MLHGFERLKIGKVQRKPIQIQDKDKLFLLMLLLSYTEILVYYLKTGHSIFVLQNISIFTIKQTNKCFANVLDLDDIMRVLNKLHKMIVFVPTPKLIMLSCGN